MRGGRQVFAEVDFSLEAGGALLLRGPNGSGKSSMLRCLAALTPLTEGTIAWDGEPIRRDLEAHRRRLRYIGHHDAVKPSLSVAENVAIWARLHGTASAGMVEQALDRFGLSALSDLPARLLSAGQRRRVALARLALEPAPLWLLDEPITGLDDDGVARLLDLIAAHRRAGGMVVVAYHGSPGFPASELSLGAVRPMRPEAAG